MRISYPINQWLFTVLIGPIGVVLIELIVSTPRNASGVFEAYLLFLIFGLLISLPTLLVNLIAFKTLTRKINSVWVLKMTLNAIAILGIIILMRFRIKGGPLSLQVFIAYSLVVLISSVFIKIETKKEAMPITTAFAKAGLKEVNGAQ
jgi:hypothetical protein